MADEPASASGRNPAFEKSEPISAPPNKQKQAGWDGAQSGPREQAGAHRAISAAQSIFPRHALCDGGGYDRRRLCRFGWAARRRTPGLETCSPNARCWPRPVRKPQAWRGRYTCLFGGTGRGTPAGAAIPELVSGRRRWRFVARLAGKCPRIGKFHNAILHPHAQNLVPRHSGTRISVLPSFTGPLVRTLPRRPCTE